MLPIRRFNARTGLAVLILLGLSHVACGESTGTEARPFVNPPAAAYGTWTWDGSNWTHLSQSVPGVTPSNGVLITGALRYSRDFGGLISFESVGWMAQRWDGSRWVADDSLPPKPPNSQAFQWSLTQSPTAYVLWDDAANQLLDLDIDQQTVWVWSDTAWKTALAPSSWPKGWAKAQDIWHVGYDPYRREVLMVSHSAGASGAVSQTWAWNGKALVRLADFPFDFDLCTTVPDAASQLLAFCGWGAYSWDGKVWSPLGSVADDCPPSSSNLLDAHFAFDPSRHQLIAVASDDYLSVHTWLWQGQTWKELAPAASPPGSNYSMQLAYDPAIKGVVLTTTAPDKLGVQPGFVHCPGAET